MSFIMANEWDRGNSELSPVKQSIGDIVMQALSQGGSAYLKGRQKRQYRESAAEILGLPVESLTSFDSDELKDLIKEKYKSSITPKEWKPATKEEAIEFETAKQSGKGGNKRIVDLMSGLTSPENVFSPKQLKQVTPSSVGRAGGGQVLTQPGAQNIDGQIIGPDGQPQGTYAEGYEPTPTPEAIAAIFRQQTGVDQPSAMRKSLGLEFGKDKQPTEGSIKRGTLKNQALEVLNRGWDVDSEGEQKDFTGRNDALAYIMNKMKADPNDPDIKEVLNRYKDDSKEFETKREGGFFGIGGKEVSTSPFKEETTKTVKQRFNELIAEGNDDDSAYEILKQEGY